MLVKLGWWLCGQKNFGGEVNLEFVTKNDWAGFISIISLFKYYNKREKTQRDARRKSIFYF